jgi:large subunit ribosomal protein L5
MNKPRLKEKYHQEIVPALQKELGYTTPMQVPKLEKIAINMGLGKAVQQPKLLEIARKELSRIAGQKAVPTKAKVSISNFKLREGMAIGARVTLHGARMYEFLDRLVNIALPNVRDFRGVSDKAFDGQGNYTLGIKDQLIFPEINIENLIERIGMNITFVIHNTKPSDSYYLLKSFGFPFIKKAK